MVVAKVPVGPANNEGGIAYGAGSIWMPSDPKGEVTRIDPATNGIAATIPVAPGSFTAVFGYGRVWVSSTDKSVVSVIHPASNKVIAEIPVDKGPRFMAAGEGYVWTLNQGTGTVTKIDPLTMTVVATIDVGLPGTGGDIAAGEGAVWVTMRDIPLTRIEVRDQHGDAPVRRPWRRRDPRAARVGMAVERPLVERMALPGQQDHQHRPELVDDAGEAGRPRR